MHVQIYGARTQEDILALIEMGVDLLGLGVSAGREEEVARLVATARGQTTIVLLPIYDDPAQIINVTRQIAPDIVHLCTLAGVTDLEQISFIREAVSPVKLMQAIPVTPAGAAYTFDSLALAKFCDPLVDYLLLDTTLGDGQEEPVPGWLGITGKTHDWAVSRAIVEQCQSPVILAGGLNPDNVAAAIRAVRPWGVDANTGLNLYPGKKDLAKCRAFIERARLTAAEYEA